MLLHGLCEEVAVDEAGCEVTFWLEANTLSNRDHGRLETALGYGFCADVSSLAGSQYLIRSILQEEILVGVKSELSHDFLIFLAESGLGMVVF